MVLEFYLIKKLIIFFAIGTSLTIKSTKKSTGLFNICIRLIDLLHNNVTFLHSLTPLYLDFLLGVCLLLHIFVLLLLCLWSLRRSLLVNSLSLLWIPFLIIVIFSFGYLHSFFIVIFFHYSVPVIIHITYLNILQLLKKYFQIYPYLLPLIFSTLCRY